VSVDESCAMKVSGKTSRVMGCFFCVVVIYAVGGCKATRPHEAPAEPHISVMTYNVNWGGGPRPELAVEIIAQSNADMVCLQETTPSWESYLGRRSKSYYSHMIFRNTPGRAGGGLGFLSKYPLTNVAYIPSKNGFFDGWVMLVKTPLGPIQILNVHLKPPVNNQGEFGVSGYVVSQEDREEELKYFLSHTKENVPIIVLGDFNEGENGKAIEWLEGQGFTNALPEFDRYANTWRWDLGLFDIKRRLDHILYSDSLHCYSARVLENGGSDHYPVLAIFGGRD